jgi:hypothetical protein
MAEIKREIKAPTAFTLPPSEIARLNAEAKKSQISRSALLRRMIVQYFEAAEAKSSTAA